MQQSRVSRDKQTSYIFWAPSQVVGQRFAESLTMSFAGATVKKAVGAVGAAVHQKLKQILRRWGYDN